MNNPFRQITAADPSFAEEALEGEYIARDTWALVGREQGSALALGGLFVAAAVTLALVTSVRPASGVLAFGLILAFAIASSVSFDISTGTTVPTQLVFIPMWFLLPNGMLPAAVAAGYLIGRLPGVLAGRMHPSRLLLCLWDSWYALGPALVFALSDPHSAEFGTWWVIVLALGAQFAFDFMGATLYNSLAHGIGPEVLVGSMMWVYLVDLFLAPVGFAIAIASGGESWAFVLGISLVGLFGMFAQERRERIRQTAELSSAYRGTAMLLGDVVEADDAYTGEHSKGVVELSLAVADKMGLSAKQRRNVEFGALLHDVGKVAISKEIINKPGPLTPEEREIINTHTLEGQRMLDRIGGVLGEVGVVVRASHEDYDGTGYPDGLAGEAIPIEARIVSCCDAFSAMTTDRSYRKARTTDEAFVELRRCAGTQFDPDVVEMLISVFNWVHPRELPEFAPAASATTA